MWIYLHTMLMFLTSLNVDEIFEGGGELHEDFLDV